MDSMGRPPSEAIRFTGQATPVTVQNQKLIRDRSSAAFGNEKFIEIVIALASTPSGSATASQLETMTGIRHPMITPVLNRLIAAEMLLALPQAYRRAQQYYEVQACPSWDALVRLCRELAWLAGVRPNDGSSLSR
jgi:hypothetical protein